jgi:hypothetical protein
VPRRHLSHSQKRNNLVKIIANIRNNKLLNNTKEIMRNHTIEKQEKARAEEKETPTSFYAPTIVRRLPHAAELETSRLGSQNAREY